MIVIPYGLECSTFLVIDLLLTVEVKNAQKSPFSLHLNVLNRSRHLAIGNEIFPLFVCAYRTYTIHL